MSRTFFMSVADALGGFLPRDAPVHTKLGPHNLKVWTRSWHEHYEVQRIGRAVLKQAGASGATGLEIGFHAEHPSESENDEALALLTAGERTWRRGLGRDPVAERFLGPAAMRQRWRRLSEVWVDVDLREDGAAIEAAERLGTYLRTMEPLLTREHTSRCACWRAG